MSIPGLFSLAITLALSSIAVAGESVSIGGDQYMSGFNAEATMASTRNTFIAGFTVTTDARVERDLDAAGLDVNVNAPVGRSLHVAGMSVNVTQPIGEDISAAGMNLRIRNAANIGGNARLLAGNLVLDAPVSGSLLAAAATLTLNGTIGGDVHVTAKELTFGPHARILGTLTYAAPQQIQIPPDVIPVDRIHFQKMEMDDMVKMGKDRVPSLWPAMATVLTTFILVLASLMLIGSILLVTAPELVGSMQRQTLKSPFCCIGLGLLTMATMLGLLQMLTITLIGILLIPLVLLAILTLWTAGYLLGVFVVTARIASSFGPLPATFLPRFVTLAVGLIVIALLNFIPIAGWLINVAVALFGIGGIFSSNWNIAVTQRNLASLPDEEREAREHPMSNSI